MAAIASIFALLGLIFLIATVVGIASPALFKDKKTGEIPKRSQILVGGICASVIAFVITGFVAPEPEKEAIQAEVSSGAQSDEVEADTTIAIVQEENTKPTLGLSLETFVDRFNTHMVKLERPYRLNPKVNNNTFSVVLNDRLALSGGVSPVSGELNNLMLIGGGDGTPQSGLDTMMVVAGAYSSVLGLDDVKTTGPEVIAVLKAHQDNPEGDAKRVLNDVKLFYTQSEMMGNFFAIEPASL